jgi:glycosyltransferase involved in cell wall biosynthesis
MTKRLVGVVVPTHNRHAVLREALAHVLAQEGVEVEVVVVDDGSSTPVTGSVVDLVGDPRVRVVRNETPTGPSAARNLGVASLGTRWVAFCDDDDLWAPDKLRAQLDAIDETPGARWSCTGSVTVDERRRVQGHHAPPPSGDVLPDLLGFNVLPAGGSAIVVDRSLFDEVGRFDPAMNRAEDWDCWIRLAQRSPIAIVPRPLVAYRVWEASHSLDTEGMNDGHRLLRERYGDLFSSHRTGQDDVALAHYLAKQQLRSGRRLAAARTFARAGRHAGLPYWVRAVAALIAPGATDRLGNARSARQVPASWRDEVAQWLVERELDPAGELA